MNALIRRMPVMAVALCFASHWAVAATRPAAKAATAADAVEPARAALRLRQLPAAVARLTALAGSGNAEAQYLLGLVYLNGVGTAIDTTLAREWLQRAAQQDHPAAAFVLAALLSRSPPIAGTTANDWLQRSAKLGYVRATEALRDPRPLLAAERATGDARAASDLALYAVRHGDLALLDTLGTAAVAARDEFGRSTLAIAAENSAASVVQWLLAHGANAQAADSFGVTPVMLAATLPDPAVLTQLLAAGATSSDVDQEQRTALFYAARLDRAAAIRLLARDGARVDSVNSHGYNALDVAVVAGADAAAAELRALGAQQSVSRAPRSVAGKFDRNKPGSIYRDWPIVALAAARDDSDELRKLVAAGADANTRTPQGDTLLHVALHAGALRSLGVLLTLGADPLAEDRRGRSTLGLSAAQADGAALKLLLFSKVDVNRHANREDAPLVIAVRAGLIDNVRLLLDTGAKANVADANRRSALSLAATQSDPQLLTLLLQHRVDVLQRDGAGRSALWHAARAGQPAAAQALLGAHADPEAADKEGHTPLIAAALSGNLATAEVLLQASVRVDAATSGGDTALLVAAAAGRTDIVQALLRASARSNLQNRYGDTALIAASRIGSIAICRALLKAGANPALRNKDRATAADLARERGFAAVANEIDGKG